MTQIEEISKNVRDRLIFMLNLWASKELQFSAQYDTIEFFEMWFDLYHPGGNAFELAFNNHEKQVVIDFGQELENVYMAYKDYPPVVEVLVATKEWKLLNELAIKALVKIKNNAT